MLGYSATDEALLRPHTNLGVQDAVRALQQYVSSYIDNQVSYEFWWLMSYLKGGKKDGENSPWKKKIINYLLILINAKIFDVCKKCVNLILFCFSLFFVYFTINADSVYSNAVQHDRGKYYNCCPFATWCKIETNGIAEKGKGKHFFGTFLFRMIKMKWNNRRRIDLISKTWKKRRKNGIFKEFW